MATGLVPSVGEFGTDRGSSKRPFAGKASFESVFATSSSESM